VVASEGLAAERKATHVGPVLGIADAELQAAAEIVRAGLAGLVLWWAENPEVPREVLVAAAVRILDPVIAG